MSKVSSALRLPSFGGKTGAARRSRPSNATCRRKSARQSLLHRSLRLRGPGIVRNEVSEKLFPSSQRSIQSCPAGQLHNSKEVGRTKTKDLSSYFLERGGAIREPDRAKPQ